MAEDYKKQTCKKCIRTLKEDNFYTYKDGSKVEICKECLTMHIDNFDPNTFLWLIEKMDIPYIESEWNVLRDRAYAKNPEKMTGMSVFGRYLSKMKLKQWKDYVWADTERLAQEEEDKKQQKIKDAERNKEMLDEELAEGKISEAQYRTMMDTADQYLRDLQNPPKGPRDPVTGKPLTPQNETSHDSPYMSEEELGDLGQELTHDDKIYLALKWGRLYKAEEWIALEKSYTDMKNSFDIQDADTENTLLLLCKTNLKLNQCIDNGDLDGASKYSRMYDSLRKSAKFTAAQNKDEKAADFDNVGCIVAFCEKEGGFIEEYCTDTPKDDIDMILKDNHQYLNALVADDPHIAKEIEDYAQRIKINQEIKEDRKRAKEEGLLATELTDQDHIDFYEEIEEEIIHDQNIEKGEEA